MTRLAPTLSALPVFMFIAAGCIQMPQPATVATTTAGTTDPAAGESAEAPAEKDRSASAPVASSFAPNESRVRANIAGDHVVFVMNSVSVEPKETTVLLWQNQIGGKKGVEHGTAQVHFTAAARPVAGK